MLSGKVKAAAGRAVRELRQRWAPPLQAAVRFKCYAYSSWCLCMPWTPHCAAAPHSTPLPPAPCFTQSHRPSLLILLTGGTFRSCSFEDNLQFNNGDLPHTINLPVASKEDCCALCQALRGCQAVVFEKPTKLCWLKTGGGYRRKEDPTCTSGILA